MAIPAEKWDFSRFVARMPPTSDSRSTAPSRGPSAEGPEAPGLLGFLFSRVFWLNVLVALVLLTAGILLAVGNLRAYTHHGEAITVPDCRGLSLEQAAAQLERKDLAWAVMDSFYDPRELPLAVLGQFPDDGAEVKEGRTVHLTVNRIRPQMVDVPVAELEEKTLRSVQFTLQGLGFRIGELIYEPGVYDNQVLEIRRGGSAEALADGARLPKGSVLDLLVTDGYGHTRVAMPNLVGMGWGEAEFVLRAHNLVEGNIRYDAGVDSSAARVYRQQPEAGPDAYVKEGTMINLWLGADSLAAPESAVP